MVSGGVASQGFRGNHAKELIKRQHEDLALWLIL
ncbi:hypothetical protein [Vibrio phage 33Fb.4]|nr:hypothetical protein [Vibrio phage 33Fb.4]UZM04661.1 hypothetical protein [Vibrio phage 31Fb.4]